MGRKAGSRYCPTVQGGGDCFPGGDFQSSRSSLAREHLTAKRNQVPASCSRNSSFKSQDVSPFGPRADGGTLLLRQSWGGEKICHSFPGLKTYSLFLAPLLGIGPLTSGPAGDSHQKVNLEQTVFRTAGNSVCPEGTDCQ